MSRPKLVGPQLYEGLFLLNQQAVAGDFNAAVEFVRNVLERAGAQVRLLKKWDERKLAYEIKGQKRGAYLLAYFLVEGVQIANIERDCNLSEVVLRNLIIKAEHVGDTEIDLASRAGEVKVEAKLREGVVSDPLIADDESEVIIPSVLE
jgi:ribosomal protein S6